MTIQTTDNDIREQAADWYDRLHELNAAEQQQYQHWLMQSPQHAAAMSWLQQQLGEHDEALLIALERVATANHKAPSVTAEEGEVVVPVWRPTLLQNAVAKAAANIRPALVVTLGGTRPAMLHWCYLSAANAAVCTGCSAAQF